jgi:hypothetical protein
MTIRLRQSDPVFPTLRASFSSGCDAAIDVTLEELFRITDPDVILGLGTIAEAAADQE